MATLGLSESRTIASLAECICREESKTGQTTDLADTVDDTEAVA